MTIADEKVLRRIRDGAHRAYPERSYADPVWATGCAVTGIFGMLLVFPAFGIFTGMMPPEISLPGTLLGVCVFLAGVLISLYYRRAYSYLGLGRYQVALSITALDLSSHGHKRVQPIISPSYPEEYQYLVLFGQTGPANLLKRMKDIRWDAETLAKMSKQRERYIASMYAIVGTLSLIAGLVAVPAIVILSVFSGIGSPFLPLLVLFILLSGAVMILHARHRLRLIERQEAVSMDTAQLSELAGGLSSKCRVEDVLTLIRSAYPHPIRVLVLGTYPELEYTGRTYYTGEGIELHEAVILPKTGVRREVMP